MIDSGQEGWYSKGTKFAGGWAWTATEAAKSVPVGKIASGSWRILRDSTGYVLSKPVGVIWDTALMLKHIPVGQYAIGSYKYLSKSTQFAIIDRETLKWLIRLDRPHPGHNYPHMNINHRFIPGRDPHLPVPNWLVDGGSGLNTTLKTVGDMALITALTVDAYRIVDSARLDWNNQGALGIETGKTVAHIGGTNTGAFTGMLTGSLVGSTIGGGVGLLFGGVGAVPGAAVGSLAGKVIGGFTGAYYTGRFAEHFVVYGFQGEGLVGGSQSKDFSKSSYWKVD